MTKKRKKRKKPIAKPQFSLPNIAIIGLSVIIAFALFSAVDKIFYSDKKIEPNHKTNLAELLTVSTYEEKYGEKITVEILNGCGAKGIADQFSKYLLEKGHDVIQKGNAQNFDYLHSEVITRNSNITAANNIANLLGISENQISSKSDRTLQCDVTLILGKDFKDLKSFSKVLEVNPTF